MVSIHRPVFAGQWLVEHEDHPCLSLFGDPDCPATGPVPFMLSPETEALVLFAPAADPVVTEGAQTLANESGFPVVIKMRYYLRETQRMYVFVIKPPRITSQLIPGLVFHIASTMKFITHSHMTELTHLDRRREDTKVVALFYVINTR